MFAVDRAGLVAMTERASGIFDLSYLRSISNMVIMSPKHKWELADMVRFGIQLRDRSRSAIRGECMLMSVRNSGSPIEYGKSEILYERK